MLAFVVRRLLQSIMVMAVVGAIAFGLFNFAGDPDAVPVNSSPHSTDPFSSANGSFGSTGRGFANQPSRVNDAFGALGYAGPTKAPPQRYVDPRDWLGWAEVRGTSLDHWGTGSGLGVVAGVPMLSVTSCCMSPPH